MKATFVLFFVVLLSWLQAGRSLELVLKQKEHKRAIKHRIRPLLGEMQKVYFTFDAVQKSEIQWIHSKEFVFKGKMYDILNRSNENGNLSVVCIEDSYEKELIRKYAEEHSDQNPFGQSVMKKLSLDYIPFQLSAFLLETKELTPKIKIGFKDNYSFQFLQSSLDPPEVNAA
ncbi:MAG: hypothetical protein KJ941_00235 [Bacteroidetes bacterium]|nr:hypothetical protein [Bacteroidota bacterium]